MRLDIPHQIGSRCDRTLQPAAYRRLKLGTRQLNGACDGLEAAAVTRVSHAALSDCASENRPDRYAAIDVIADLEAVAGTPIVTRVLAALAGYELRSTAQSRDEEAVRSLHRHDVAVARADGAFAAAEYDAIADGRLTPAELRALIEREEATIAAHRARLDLLWSLAGAGRPALPVDATDGDAS